jgi:hypothetical protein
MGMASMGQTTSSSTMPVTHLCFFLRWIRWIWQPWGKQLLHLQCQRRAIKTPTVVAVTIAAPTALSQQGGVSKIYLSWHWLVIEYRLAVAELMVAVVQKEAELHRAQVRPVERQVACCHPWWQPRRGGETVVLVRWWQTPSYQSAMHTFARATCTEGFCSITYSTRTPCCHVPVLAEAV